MDNCIFCKIANHEIPSKSIYEDDYCLAFLDLSQTTDGHTLVIPKKHYKNLVETDNEVLAHLFEAVQKTAKILEEKLDAKGFNFVSNMNEVAGQTVHHVHIHIIPRYSENDTFELGYQDRSKEVDLNAIYNSITK